MRRGLRSAVLIGLGFVLILAGLGLSAYNLWDESRAEITAQTALEHLAAELPEPVLPQVPQSTVPQPAEPVLPEDPDEVEIPDYILDPAMEMPVREIEGMEYIGVLQIPTLGLELPIGSSWSYPALRQAPCRYTGSAYQSDMVIAAHNYRKHFGGLSRIGLGDPLTFCDVDGNVFSYQVVEVEVLQPQQIEEMCAGDWDLTLFTCTVGGQSRLTVRCEAVKN